MKISLEDRLTNAPLLTVNGEVLLATATMAAQLHSYLTTADLAGYIEVMRFRFRKTKEPEEINVVFSIVVTFRDSRYERTEHFNFPHVMATNEHWFSCLMEEVRSFIFNQIKDVLRDQTGSVQLLEKTLAVALAKVAS